jgi:hypothetical protein
MKVAAWEPAAEPTLAETCAVLKRELELSGNVTEVVSSACRVLGVDDTGTLVARAKKCREVLGAGTGGEIAAGAALAGTVIEGTVEGTIISVGAVAPVAAQPPMARKLQPEGGAPVQPSVVSSAELALARELFEKRVGRWAGRASLGSCTTVDIVDTVTRGGAASSFYVESNVTISLCCIPVHFLRVPGTYSAEGGSGTSFDGSVITATLESADLNARTVTYRYGGTRKDGSLQQGCEVVHRDFIEKRVPRFTVRLERQGF